MKPKTNKKNLKKNLTERLQDVKTRDRLLNGADREKPTLNPIEIKVKELVDAATLVCIFKNEDVSGQFASIPTKAMNDLENSIKSFSPKIWDQIQLERDSYLKFAEIQTASEESEPVATKETKPGLWRLLFGAKNKT